MDDNKRPRWQQALLIAADMAEEDLGEAAARSIRYLGRRLANEYRRYIGGPLAGRPRREVAASFAEQISSGDEVAYHFTRGYWAVYKGVEQGELRDFVFVGYSPSKKRFLRGEVYEDKGYTSNDS